MNKKTFAAAMLRRLVYATGVVLCLHLLLQFLNLEVFYQQNGQIYELSNRFDLDDESSVPTWFSQFLFLAFAAVSFLAAHLANKRSLARMWRGFGLLGVIFSVDEIATLHEHILQSLHVILFQDEVPTSFANAWWLVGPVAVLAAGWIIWKVHKLLPPSTTKLLAASGIIFLTGAIIFDALTSVVPREAFLNQGLLVAVEETMELLGVILALYAAVDYVELSYKSRIRRAIKQLATTES